MKIYPFVFLLLVLTATSCNFFKSKDEDAIDIPKGITAEQLQDTRYKFKRDKSYKQQFLNQQKTDSAVITIYNIINYQIKDDEANIGEGFDYYIFDISVDNPTSQPFHIGNFTKSCYLTNENPEYLYSNVGFALKMYYLQSDSSEIDMEYTKRFYSDIMPAKEFYRTKLFAFEVSKEAKDPLFFHYSIGSQKFTYKVRDALR